MTRLIVLTGAPTLSTLHWDENALFEPRKTDGGVVDNTKSPESSAAYSAQWRQVPTVNKYDGADGCKLDCTPFICLGEVISSPTANSTFQTECQHTRTLTSASLSMASRQTPEEMLDDFYTQSFALNDETTASELSELQTQATIQKSSQCNDTATQMRLPSPVDHGGTPLPFQISLQRLYDIKDIQSATYLQSIECHAITVNLVVAIMTLSSPRRVTVGRRWGRPQETQLLEMLVADDTRAGFEITIWLSNNRQSNGRGADRSVLESQMQRLRPQDIVLLRNVALCAYQGRVCGQSLRRDGTKVDLLYRRAVDGADGEGVYSPKQIFEPARQDPVLKKAQGVKKWLMNFVGHDLRGEHGGASRTGQPLLPPDTQ